MKFTLALTLDRGAQTKGALIHKFFADLNAFIQNESYGNDVLEYFIILQVINPPAEFEHLFKDFKPR